MIGAALAGIGARLDCACDAMEGGGTLTVSAVVEMVRGGNQRGPAVLQPGRYLRLSVADTGAGMAPEVLVREITAQGLEREGFSVSTATSGEKALSLLDAGEAVDLLVTDLSMPGMDGLALIREAQRRRLGLRAILLTGFATDAAELALGGAVSGAFTLLRKPCGAPEIAERAAVLLEGSPPAEGQPTRP